MDANDPLPPPPPTEYCCFHHLNSPSTKNAEMSLKLTRKRMYSSFSCELLSSDPFSFYNPTNKPQSSATDFTLKAKQVADNQSDVRNIKCASHPTH
jgi:hypothetical protein